MRVATNDPLEVRVRTRLAQLVPTWLGSGAAPELVEAGVTRAARWYRYEVGGSRLFVKAPNRALTVPGTQRPRVLPLPDFASKHLVEHAWLRRVHATALGGVHTFGVLEDPPALVMEDVRDPTLHDVLSAGALRSVGRWLQAYHQIPDALGDAPGAVLASEDEVRATAAGFEEALGPRATPLAALVRECAQAICGAPRALVHGDLAPTNVFVGDEGDIRAIDPLPWHAPALLDLAYLATAVRTSRSALLVPGRQRQADVLVAALVDGYGGIEQHDAAFAGLSALTLLDKWAALDARGAAGSVVDRALKRRLIGLAGDTLPT